MSFFIYPIFKWTIIVFPFNIEFIVFSLDNFFNFKFFLICLLQFILVKRSNNFFSIKIINNTCPRYIILTFLITKIFWPTCSVTFRKYIFIFWYSRIFIIDFFTRVNLCVWLYINKFHFNCVIICIIVFINYII